MRFLALACLGALMIAACETPPEPPTEMEAAAFQSAVADARDEWHPYASINKMTALLENEVLSPSQRSRLLFERAKLETEARINLPRAIRDLREVQSVSTTTLFNDQTDALIEQAEASLAAARARLAGLQNLPNWFDDKVAVGEIGLAADRFRESGLSPDPQDAGLLEAAGYLCRKSLGNSDDWQYGYDNQHLEKLEWCKANDIS